MKDAREDLQKLTKLLLQKKLENEDMEAKVCRIMNLSIFSLSVAVVQSSDRCSNTKYSLEFHHSTRNIELNRI